MKKIKINFEYLDFINNPVIKEQEIIYKMWWRIKSTSFRDLWDEAVDFITSDSVSQFEHKKRVLLFLLDNKHLLKP